MPLSKSAPRALSHDRRLELKAYEREDGLWDIEGHITDHKLEDYDMLDSVRTADEPVHDMWLRLTINRKFVVRAVEAVMDAGAHTPCPHVTPNYDRLVGLKMGRGWNRAIRESLGGISGCTHLNEMLAQMATTALQSLFEAEGNVAERPGGSRYLSPGLHNSCHAYSLSSPYIRDHFPDYYKTE